MEKVQLLKPWFLRSGRGDEFLNNGPENTARTRSQPHPLRLQAFGSRLSCTFSMLLRILQFGDVCSSVVS